MQLCPICKREMTPLFTSYACDFCDGLVSFGSLSRAYVAWPRGAVEARTAYLFPSRDVAERWVIAAHLEGHEVREVATADEIRWHMSRGTVEGIELADHVFEVFPDHRFELAPYRAFLV